jgi:hypothetical protein
MKIREILRIEGIAMFTAAIVAYFTLDAPVWLFVVLALAPDISMVGYLAGSRIGSYAYNAFHTYTVPVVLGAAGIWLGIAPLLWIALVWTAHIGVDRAIGYGLKSPTGFKHTHLSAESDPHDHSTRDVEVDTRVISATK